MSISPHGGRLVQAWASPDEREEWLARARSMPTWTVRTDIIQDLWMIAMGAYSPLGGFMERADFESVLMSMHLTSGWPWTIPIVLDVDTSFAQALRDGEWIALRGSDGEVVAVMEVRERFPYSKEAWAQAVYQTLDLRHPGVARLMTMHDTLLAGPVRVLRKPDFGAFQRYYMEPLETRALFAARGWQTIVAFQTRNPIHRAHEYLHRLCLEFYDALFIHPIVGETKDDDVPAAVRIRCYETIIETYYPKERVVLALNPAAMRYAGPREAIFHAIVRKNFGCTHFIVGRDHAGVGNFYDPFAAHRIFEAFDPDRLGIRPIRFDEAFYCHRCASMATPRTCPHGVKDRLVLSGTKVRAMLRAGVRPPIEYTRPEVADILIEALRGEEVGDLPTWSVDER